MFPEQDLWMHLPHLKVFECEDSNLPTALTAVLKLGFKEAKVLPLRL